eukprot:TRINITY_DN23966_c0_g1_i1.p1 TRINITY_DN23966_c0_g1~~TRINITY_DN23966_c0_g1_i1.p1  ORF type:complete len:180 (-),score=28.43 TRINITY_DN23966_c0_g1_i1:439-978(-)
MLARFRVTNIGPKVTAEELQEALTETLCLDDVTMEEDSLRKSAIGQEAEIELPDEEGDLLRGPMARRKVRIGQPMTLHFEEIGKRQNPNAPKSPLPMPRSANSLQTVVKQDSDDHKDEPVDHEKEEHLDVLRRQVYGDEDDDLGGEPELTPSPPKLADVQVGGTNGRACRVCVSPCPTQ